MKLRLPALAVFTLPIITALVLFASWGSLLGGALRNLGNIQLHQFLLSANVPLQHKCLYPDSGYVSSKQMPQEFAEARANLNLSIRYHNDDSVYLSIALAYLARGDSHTAKQVLADRLLRSDGNWRLHFLLGCVYMYEENTNAAVFEWRQIPGLVSWHVRRGDVLRVAGDLDGALLEYNAAAQIEPDSYVFHQIGRIQAQLGHVDQAMEEYKQAYSLGQTEIELYSPEMSLVELAKLYIARQQWQDAREVLEQAISSAPMLAEAWELRGEVYYKGFSNLELANNSLEHSIELNPSAAKSYVLLGSFNRAQGHYETAEKWLNIGLTLPTNMWTPWIHGERGRIFLEQENYAEAIPELKAVVDAVPTDVWYLELIGDAYAGLGQFKEATGYYRQILSMSPDNVRVQKKLSEYEDRSK